MFKEFLFKKMAKSQLKDMPEAQREQLMAMFEKNPDLFMKISKEIQAEMKSGKDQMSASMAVMKKHEKELKELASNS